MSRRLAPIFLTGLAVCLLAAPVLWPQDHLQQAAADPLACDEPNGSVIHLAQLAFAKQEQSPVAAPDRAKSKQSSQQKQETRAAKPTVAVHAQQQQQLQQQQQPMPASFSPETVMSCLEVARDIDPELGRELARKQEKNPAEFEQALRTGQVGRGLWSLVQLRQRDPHLYRLKISEMTQSLQINRKAAELHEAMKSNDAGRIDAVRAQLRELLQLQLAMSLKARAEYLCKIEEQVIKLRNEIDHDAANFHAIVDARLKQYMENPPQADPTAILPAAAEKQAGERSSTSP